MTSKSSHRRLLGQIYGQKVKVKVRKNGTMIDDIITSLMIGAKLSKAIRLSVDVNRNYLP